MFGNLFRRIGEGGENQSIEQLDINLKETPPEEGIDQNMAYKQSQFEELIGLKIRNYRPDGNFPLPDLIKIIREEIENEVKTCGSDIEYCDQMSAALEALKEKATAPENLMAVIATISPKTKNPFLQTAIDIAK
jgi:hypothetical protein